jgi:hypothetical protein
VAYETQTHFLNVDLDVWSRSRLEAFAKALEPRLSLHYVGAEGKRQGAHFGHWGGGFDADANDIVLRLVKAVEQLPPRLRRVWKGASARELNVGVQAAGEPHSFELKLSAKAVAAAARAGCGIVLTVYAPREENLGPAAICRPAPGAALESTVKSRRKRARRS